MKHEDMIKDLETLKEFFEEQSGAYPMSLEYAIEALRASPRKTGKWIRIGGLEKCSVCGYTCDDEYYIGKFCQNCGAEMNR